MCPPDTSAVGACVSALSSVCSRGSGCPSQLGLGTVAWRVLDHGRTFAPCCWAGICPAEQSSGARAKLSLRLSLFQLLWRGCTPLLCSTRWLPTQPVALDPCMLPGLQTSGRI